MEAWVAETTSGMLWAEDTASAQRAFRAGLEQAGVGFYAYGNYRTGFDHPYVDTTYPEAWVRRYLARRYQFIDPVVLEARRNTQPFAWQYALNRQGRLSPEQRRLFAEAAEFGLVDGFSIPFHDASGCQATLNFAFSEREQLKRAMAVDSPLKVLGVYYHTTIERLLLETGMLDDILSPMEQDCLHWMAAGRSHEEISTLTSQPAPAVARALDSVRAKMGTATTDQALAVALAHGLIRLQAPPIHP